VLAFAVLFTNLVLRPLAYRLHPVLPEAIPAETPCELIMLHSIREEQNDANEQTHIRAEITTAGRNNEAIEQVVMRLSIEDDISILSWSIMESAME
jgi:putative Mg2+ transporter-C (MgtC) family protein